MVVNNVYTYNPQTQSLTVSQSGIQSSVYSALPCSCQNALKEVQYTVYYTMGGNGLYKVSSILADVVVYSSYTPANSGVCSGLSQVNVPVTYGLKFVPANGQAFRSGNPGYIFGKPVLVNEGGQVDKNGFKLFSDD